MYLLINLQTLYRGFKNTSYLEKTSGNNTKCDLCQKRITEEKGVKVRRTQLNFHTKCYGILSGNELNANVPEEKYLKAKAQ